MLWCWPKVIKVSISGFTTLVMKVDLLLIDFNISRIFRSILFCTFTKFWCRKNFVFCLCQFYLKGPVKYYYLRWIYVDINHLIIIFYGALLEIIYFTGFNYLVLLYITKKLLNCVILAHSFMNILLLELSINARIMKFFIKWRMTPKVIEGQIWSK